MERFIKPACMLTAILFVVITVISFTNQATYAGGGINWKVTVQNPTNHKVQVTPYLRHPNLKIKPESAKGIIISPGGSHTWETGSLCPASIEGRIHDGKQWLEMKSMDCLGGDHDFNAGVLTTCCWDISATVCQKAGQNYNEMRDHDYGFCKN